MCSYPAPFSSGPLQSLQRGALAARTSRVFALRSDKKKLLEVARETYKENLMDVDGLLKELQSTYPEILDDVELSYSIGSGFCFTIAEESLDRNGGQLPKIFSRLVRGDLSSYTVFTRRMADLRALLFLHSRRKARRLPSIVSNW